jgi:hypothetical protein
MNMEIREAFALKGHGSTGCGKGSKFIGKLEA